MTGKVISVNKELATVEIFCEQNDSDLKYHCGACGQFFKQQKLTSQIIMKNNINASVGDLVEYDLEKNGNLKAAALLLLVPLLVLLFSSGLVFHLNMKIWLNLLISFGSLVITFILLKIVLKNKTYFYIRGKKGEITQ